MTSASSIETNFFILSSPSNHQILYLSALLAQRRYKKTLAGADLPALLPMWNREDAGTAISRGEFPIDSPAIYGAG
jgi:hypothetical protein